MKSETQAESARSGGKRTRLMIDISPELRRRIRVAAAQRDLTLKEYVERILEQAVPETENTAPVEPVRRPVSQEFVDGLRQVREQIQRNHPGVVFDDSVELIRRMREERTEHLMSLLDQP